MAQRNLADCLPTDTTEENELPPMTSRGNDARFQAEDEIRHYRDKNLATQKATTQSTAAENSVHQEQTLQSYGDETSSNVRSASRREASDTNRKYSPESTRLEVSAGVECASPSNENATDRDQELSQLGAIILGRVRTRFLFRLGAAGEEYVPGLGLLNPGLPRFSIMVNRNKKVDLVWSRNPEPLPDDVADALHHAWPRHRYLDGMEKVILESCGNMPVIQAHWQWLETWWPQVRLRQHGIDQTGNDINFFALELQWHQWCLDAARSKQTREGRGSAEDVDTSPLPIKFRGQVVYCELKPYKQEQHLFLLDQLACVLSYDQPFLLPLSKRHLGNSETVFDLEGLLSFLHRDFQGGLHSWYEVDAQTTIQFQFRYFRPINESRSMEREVRYPCLLGDRERAIIGRGSYIQCLEEKRVRVGLRVSQYFPGLFSILILADEHMSPAPEDWTRNRKSEHTKRQVNWARYGLRPCGKGTGITNYMFEVSRVLERSLNAWNNALDSVDKLVHVNLSDFEDEKRVEDLMFDKSFTRSKDYFIAIQLLRIMDEWLDELLLSIDDLHSMPVWSRDRFGVDDAQDNINAAIKGMKERATRLQSRIRKKSEQIKSLRDGLFNATSLREATKAMALNQAIYIFTIVTVLFTPVSFLATFWALPFLNNTAEEGSDMVPEPTSFRSSFVTLPLLTYALVIGIAWYMRPDQSRYRLPDWLVGIWDTTRETISSAWNSFPREIKRERKKAQGGSDAGDSA